MECRHRVVLTLRKTVREVRAEGDHFEHEVEAFVSRLIMAAAGAPSGDQARELQIVRVGAATARGPEPHVEVELEIGGVPDSVLREALTPTFFSRLGLDDAACQALGEQLVCPATVDVIVRPASHLEPEPELQSPLQLQTDLPLPPPLAISRGWSHHPIDIGSESSHIVEISRDRALKAIAIAEARDDDELNDRADESFVTARGEVSVRSSPTAGPPVARTISAYE
jgi:hypothetical protein